MLGSFWDNENILETTTVYSSSQSHCDRYGQSGPLMHVKLQDVRAWPMVWHQVPLTRVCRALEPEWQVLTYWF